MKVGVKVHQERLANEMDVAMMEHPTFMQLWYPTASCVFSQGVIKANKDKYIHPKVFLFCTIFLKYTLLLLKQGSRTQQLFIQNAISEVVEGGGCL